MLGRLCLHYWFHFFMAFLEQKLIYTINNDLILCLAHFFGQDYLLNLIILGVYAKR